MMEKEAAKQKLSPVKQGPLVVNVPKSATNKTPTPRANGKIYELVESG